MNKSFENLSQPLVSICMAVWNGELYLKQAIESLINQDWKNIEFLILDNQSTDSSALICQEFSKNDKRIHFILDKERRGVIEAQKYLASISKGEYLMVACDDDIYLPNYISTLMNLHRLNPTIGLAYCGYLNIDSNGAVSPSGLRRFFKAKNSRFENFYEYLKWRDPMPIIFGVVKADAHNRSLPFYTLANERFSNHDNLYLLKLLSDYKVDSTPEALFFYRLQDRVALYEKRGAYTQKSPWQEYLAHITHQLAVTQVISKIISESSFASNQKFMLFIRNQLVLIYYSRPKYLINNFRGRWFKKISG